jgi:radical SAM protein with 4Fe4S-binding SPASM domain
MLSNHDRYEGYYYLNSHIVFNMGQIYGVLIDTNRQILFHLDELESKVAKMITRRCSYSEIVDILHIDPSLVRKCLWTFLKMGIAFKSNLKIYVDRINVSLAAETFAVIAKSMIKVNELVIKYPGTCSLNCLFCTDLRYLYCGCKKNDSGDGISQETIESAVEDAQMFGCKSILIMGGDPFLTRDIRDTIERILRVAKGKIGILSNLSDINPKIRDLIRSTGVHVKVPLFSTDPKKHDNITRRKGSFEQTIFHVRELIKYGVSTSAILYSNIRKKGEHEQGLKVLKELGFAKIERDRYLYDGDNQNVLFLQKNIAQIMKLHHDGDTFLTKVINVCSYQKIVVDYKGNIFPCQGAVKPIGNIKKSHLGDFLREGKITDYWFKKNSYSKCKRCEYDLICTSCHRILSHNKKRNPYCQYDPERR